MNNSKEKQTIEDFLSKFDHFTRTPKGNVIIHPGLPYDFMELTGDFVRDLKADTAKRVGMAAMKMDELNALEKFAILVLEDAY